MCSDDTENMQGISTPPPPPPAASLLNIAVYHSPTFPLLHHISCRNAFYFNTCLAACPPVFSVFIFTHN